MSTLKTHNILTGENNSICAIDCLVKDNKHLFIGTLVVNKKLRSDTIQLSEGYTIKVPKALQRASHARMFLDCDLDII